MADPWYPGADHYYVPPSEAGAHPLRQGDLIGPVTINGVALPIVQLVHPTCELAKGQLREVQVCEIAPLGALADDFQRSCVVAGQRERDGRMMVAFAHTFYLPRVDGDAGGYADFRHLQLAEVGEIVVGRRIHTMSHDARVFFVRRWLYFRFRIHLALEQVRALEAARIRADSAFVGPRPAWAASAD